MNGLQSGASEVIKREKYVKGNMSAAEERVYDAIPGDRPAGLERILAVWVEMYAIRSVSYFQKCVI